MELIVADEVAERLDSDQLRMLRTGELATHPEYQCWQCGQAGDLNREPAAVVLFVDEPRGVIALGWVHGRCGPSAVYPLSQMDVWNNANARDGQAGKRDEVYTTRVQIEDVLYPALIVVPGWSIAASRPGSATMLDSCVEEMRREGFAAVDMPASWRRPVELPEWSVHVRAGNLLSVTRPDGELWWAWSDTTAPCRMDDAWLAAALRTRRVLLMVTGVQLTAHVDDDEAVFRAALASASSADRLVGAVVSLNSPQRR